MLGVLLSTTSNADAQGASISKAKQCQTNPWPAVPEWPWCSNAHAVLTTDTVDYRKKCWCRTNFYPAFWCSRKLLYIGFFNIIYCSKINTVSNRLRTSLSTACNLDVQWESLSPPPTPAVWTCKVYPISLQCWQDYLFHSMLCMLVFWRRLNCMGGLMLYPWVFPSLQAAVWMWRCIPFHTLLKPDETEHYATLAWSR